MKKLLVSLIVLLCVFYVNAQDNFSLHFAQTYAKFKFVDSDGNSDENLTSDIKYSYGLNYSKVFAQGIFIRPELGYKNLGATSILNNQKLDWSLHYVDVNAGGGYIINKYKLKPYLGAAFYFSYLYKANQTTGSYYYDIKANEDIKGIDYGFNVYLGAIYGFTDIASVFFELRNSTGLCQLEPNTEGQSQELYNRALSFHFG